MTTPTIEVNNLTKKFKNTLAVKNINFKINKGSIIGLLGPNGCGKSTTIGMMLGLIKPTSGNVLINNQNIENNRTSLLEKMNFISPYIELPKKLTVEENLKVYGRLYGVKDLKEKINNAFYLFIELAKSEQFCLASVKSNPVHRIIEFPYTI